MDTNICFIYPWATFGGCERVFINRAMAFQKYLPGTKVDFLFLNDGGGLKDFSSALIWYGLEDIARTITSIDSKYDLISIVDCPQYIDKLNIKTQCFIVECHTSYQENRKYLMQLLQKDITVVTPSLHFSNLVQNEFSFPEGSVREVRNFVPWDIGFGQSTRRISLPAWTRKPILFFGRMDHLKDPISLLDAFCYLESRRKGEFMLLLCGPRSTEINIEKEVAARGLKDITVLIPPVPFFSADTLMQAVAACGGIFVSPSRGESFGLSAAEAISLLLPVVLSDIEAHKYLVGEYDSLFTYSSGDADALAERILYLSDHHETARDKLRDLRNRFSSQAFIQDWKSLIGHLGI